MKCSGHKKTNTSIAIAAAIIIIFAPPAATATTANTANTITNNIATT